MEGNNDDEIFYEANDNIYESANPSDYTKKRLSKESNIRTSIYEDAIDNKADVISEELENLESITINATTLETEKTDKLNDNDISSDVVNNKNVVKEKERKLELLRDDLKEITINVEFLKKNFRQIISKNKGIKEKHFHMLFELQNFVADSEQIWTAKISYDGKYLATGGKSGVLKVWEIYSENESLDNYEYKGFISYFKLFNENAYRVYTEHTKDIIDLCWNTIVMLYFNFRIRIICYQHH